jgi:nucleoside-triphosphatase
VRDIKRVLLLTGTPGVGKTAVLTKVVNILKEKGYRVGGMISREIREGGVRVGFEILDLTSEKRGWLAHVKQRTGPQMGKYRVNLENLESIGAKAITVAVENCDVVAIDEVGPMELFSEKFKDATHQVLESHKLVIAVVHGKARDKLINYAKSMKEAETYLVTTENRNDLSIIIAGKAIKAIEKTGNPSVTALKNNVAAEKIRGLVSMSNRAKAH